MAGKGTKVSAETAENIVKLIRLIGTVTEVSKLLGIKRQTLLYRIKALSFSTESALAISRLGSKRCVEVSNLVHDIENPCKEACRLGKGGEK